MNKNIFLTGASQGIGRAILEKFTKNNFNVFFCDLHKPKFSLHPEKNFFYQCDISDFSQVKILASKLKNINFTSIINNAAINLQKSIKDITYEQFDKIIKVNVYGAFNITKNLYKNLDLNNNPSIINIGSDQSLIAKPNKLAYATSKGAILQFTKSLAVDLASSSIRVNCVCPGPINTPMLRKMVNLKNFNFQQPIKRLGKASEVADLVYFLCSNKSLYITGTAIAIDGGYTSQ